MTVKHKSLGRNLSALLGQSSSSALKDKPKNNAYTQLPITSLQPGKYQPRREFNDQQLTELASSIKQQGVLQPLVVREIGGNQYEILAGERRFRASQRAGLSDIPVIIKQVDDETAMVIALVENLQREDLNAMDQARSMHRLTDEFDLTHQQIADFLGKSRTAVSNYLRLLSLHDEIKLQLENGDLEMGHARTLIGLNPEQQIQVANLIVARNLSVRETEKLIQRMKHPKPQDAEKPALKKEYSDAVTQLTRQFNTKVDIKKGKSGKGTLVIHFNSPDGLSKLIEQMTACQ